MTDAQLKSPSINDNGDIVKPARSHLFHAFSQVRSTPVAVCPGGTGKLKVMCVTVGHCGGHASV